MAENNKVNLAEVLQSLLNVLDARSRDVMTRRYGIKTGEPETLEGIGREYGITRERVRQIQSQAKKNLLDLSDRLVPVSELYESLFQSHGGVMTEDYATEVVKDWVELKEPKQPVVIFFLDLLPPYEYVTRDRVFIPHWRHPKMVKNDAEQILAVAQRVLTDTGRPVREAELLEKMQAALQAKEDELSAAELTAYLTASRAIGTTPFNEWGLAIWPETSPRGVGDKAYAVLRRHGQPEHFTRITEMINEANFDHKRANPQTVHNELIKDSRFVLVGRGLYGLTEWGYVPGTVSDVIERILTDAKRPLTRDEVIERVLSQRKVKKNTILLGLQNQKRFIRTEDNRYALQ